VEDTAEAPRREFKRLFRSLDFVSRHSVRSEDAAIGTLTKTLASSGDLAAIKSNFRLARRLIGEAEEPRLADTAGERHPRCMTTEKQMHPHARHPH